MDLSKFTIEELEQKYHEFKNDKTSGNLPMRTEFNRFHNNPNGYKIISRNLFKIKTLEFMQYALSYLDKCILTNPYFIPPNDYDFLYTLFFEEIPSKEEFSDKELFTLVTNVQYRVFDLVYPQYFDDFFKDYVPNTIDAKFYPFISYLSIQFHRNKAKEEKCQFAYQNKDQELILQRALDDISARNLNAFECFSSIVKFVDYSYYNSKILEIMLEYMKSSDIFYSKFGLKIYTVMMEELININERLNYLNRPDCLDAIRWLIDNYNDEYFEHFCNLFKKICYISLDQTHANRDLIKDEIRENFYAKRKEGDRDKPLNEYQETSLVIMSLTYGLSRYSTFALDLLTRGKELTISACQFLVNQIRLDPIIPDKELIEASFFSRINEVFQVNEVFDNNVDGAFIKIAMYFFQEESSDQFFCYLHDNMFDRNINMICHTWIGFAHVYSDCLLSRRNNFKKMYDIGRFIWNFDRTQDFNDLIINGINSLMKIAVKVFVDNVCNIYAADEIFQNYLDLVLNYGFVIQDDYLLKVIKSIIGQMKTSENQGNNSLEIERLYNIFDSNLNCILQTGNLEVFHQIYPIVNYHKDKNNTIYTKAIFDVIEQSILTQNHNLVYQAFLALQDIDVQNVPEIDLSSFYNYFPTLLSEYDSSSDLIQLIISVLMKFYGLDSIVLIDYYVENIVSCISSKSALVNQAVQLYTTYASQLEQPTELLTHFFDSFMEEYCNFYKDKKEHKSVQEFRKNKEIRYNYEVDYINFFLQNLRFLSMEQNEQVYIFILEFLKEHFQCSFYDVETENQIFDLLLDFTSKDQCSDLFRSFNIPWVLLNKMNGRDGYTKNLLNMFLCIKKVYQYSDRNINQKTLEIHIKDDNAKIPFWNFLNSNEKDEVDAFVVFFNAYKSKVILECKENGKILKVHRTRNNQERISDKDEISQEYSKILSSEDESFNDE